MACNGRIARSDNPHLPHALAGVGLVLDHPPKNCARTNWWRVWVSHRRRLGGLRRFYETAGVLQTLGAWRGAGCRCAPGRSSPVRGVQFSNVLFTHLTLVSRSPASSSNP